MGWDLVVGRRGVDAGSEDAGADGNANAMQPNSCMVHDGSYMIHAYAPETYVSTSVVYLLRPNHDI